MNHFKILYQAFLDQYELNIILTDDMKKQETLLLEFLSSAKAQKFSKEIIREMLEHLCRQGNYPLSAFLEILTEIEIDNNINPYDSKNNESTTSDWGAIAQSFLIFLKDHYGICSLKYFREDFYFWNKGRYFIMPEKEIGSYLLRFINLRDKKLKGRKMSSLLKEVLIVLESLCYIRSDHDLPFYLKPPNNLHLGTNVKKVNWLTVGNGIIDIDSFIFDSKIQLGGFNENYFSMTKLKFDYNPNAICTNWMSILRHSLVEDDVINLLQEWFGYNLINHNKCAKFMILYGLPAAGKSVILRVLSLLVGEDNYSTIGLENFDIQRSFSLAHLQGKLANLIFDSNDIKRANEGVVKQFVSGEPLTVERKYKNPFVMKSTAKLTIATNHELKFSDKTDSLWRRMLLLHFKKSISKESEQNKNYVSNDWWINSGELSGILNWALEGLLRLEKRGDFLIPESVKKDIEIYRKNINATTQFIESFLVEDSKSEIPSHWLYRDYRKYCMDYGFYPQNAQNFAKELKTMFPNIESSSNTKTMKDPRGIDLKHEPTRIWRGIDLKHEPTRIWRGINYSIALEGEEVTFK